MDGLDKMIAAQLRTDPEFRAVFIHRILANLEGRRASRYDNAKPRVRKRHARRQLVVFGDIIGAEVEARQKAAHHELPPATPQQEAVVA